MSFILILVMLLAGAAQADLYADVTVPGLDVYNDPGTGAWDVVAREDKIAECGLDPDILDTIDASHTYPYAIVRYGKLCHEYYPPPPEAQLGEITGTFSVTKTMGAAGVGRAVKMSKGLADSLEDTDRMDDWITGITFNADATVRDVLSMTAQSADITFGNREFEYDANGTAQVNRLVDVVEAVIAQDPAHFGSPTDFQDFVDQWIWTPLGMTESVWIGGDIHVGWGASLRDMARFGLLLMHNGVWNQQRILSAEWVHKMTHPVYEDANTGMGYLTWLAASRNYKIPGLETNFQNPASTCQPSALWRTYPHEVGESPDCNYEGAYSCSFTHDVGVFAANGGLGQMISGHRGLDLVIVAKDKTVTDLISPEWDLIRDAFIPHDPKYSGNPTGFCNAYAAGNYAPDLVYVKKEMGGSAASGASLSAVSILTLFSFLGLAWLWRASK